MPEHVDFDRLAIEVAALDKDLIAWFELNNLGYTSMDISEARIDALEELPVSQIEADIKETYGLSDEHWCAVRGLCLFSIGQRRFNVE